jgi:uncharacterized protein (DUF362 family)
LKLDRRRFLETAAAAALVPLAARCGRTEDEAPPHFDAVAARKAHSARVAILPASAYHEGLVDTVLAGLRACEVAVRGARVVLKPNLVEYDPRSVINTHPLLVAAAAEAFRRLDAREVIVAEGPGHRRDTEHVLLASGLHEALRDIGAPYVDLNVDRVRRTQLASRFTDLGHLYLPHTVLDADLFVSMPKLKTHHWAGVTLSMKNLFGIVPGSVYGWPKNPLHWEGIHNSILDLNATLPARRFAIVDGIVGMEGNGPIQGDAREAGLLVFGEDPVAVDATGARIMGLEPLRVPHLREGGRFLGHAEMERIEQIGEPLESHVHDFAVLERFRGWKESV